MSEYGFQDELIAGLRVGVGDASTVEGFSNGDSANLSFGDPCFTYQGEALNEGCVWPFYVDGATIVYDADFQAAETTNVTVNTVATGVITFVDTHANMMLSIVSGINGLAVDGIEAVLDPADANNRTIHVRTKATTNATSTVTVGPGATVTQATTQIFAGAIEKQNRAFPYYEEGAAVNVVAKGWTAVPSDTASVSNTPTYISTSTGKFTATAGLAINSKFRYDNTSAGLTVVETKGQVDLGIAEKF